MFSVTHHDHLVTVVRKAHSFQSFLDHLGFGYFRSIEVRPGDHLKIPTQIKMVHDLCYVKGRFRRRHSQPVATTFQFCQSVFHARINGVLIHSFF